MDFEPIYHASRAENDALQSVRGRIHVDPRLVPQPYARAFAEQQQAKNATAIRRWYAALFVLFVLGTLTLVGSMALLMVMNAKGN